ncbi:hypothetical protein K6W16_02715 [Burkholderia dolosa]|uniref:Tse2 ADP-ribosyltransferase toxin domain-containing protein n=1 Tax=Burkholderia dolosa TaxID=152500 RepID=A0A892IB40_9BURK|nr:MULTISPECIES: hypothetical protein [Burkholderia]MBR8416735.1 hypothetical protein [Burkholderia dolosa]MBY4655909.1 hypothetical protein [Burkholderia dolosa]MBY4687175.1 hypothetical protein [Burkholderia dolosa]MBY4780258.1 hypothetical protein [Burkholderia dolosa]MBY4787567.1 hypothetical protein [Burkholderia dolosa]
MRALYDSTVETNREGVVPADEKYLYIEEGDFLRLDLYRFGNSTSSRLDHVRPFKDVMVAMSNGVRIIVANRNGISLTSKYDPKKRGVWRIPRDTRLPAGLLLIKDLRPGHEGHYMLAPSSSMPFAKFIGLLQELAMYCQKVS